MLATFTAPSHFTAFGITPLKSLSALPAAAMTTAAEPRVSVTESVNVCLIVQCRRARMCEGMCI